jgi:MFS family permease
MYFAINLGFPIGTVVGGVLAEHWFRGLFLLDALTTAAYATIILLLVRESLPGRLPRSRATSAAPPSHLTNNSVRLAEAAGVILRDFPFLVFCAGSLLLGLAYIQSFATLPVFMSSVGISASLYGRLMAVNGIMIVLLQIPMTAWMKRHNRIIFVLAAPVLTGLGFGATAMAEAWSGFAMTIVVWTLGEIMIAPYGPSIVSDLAPAALRARYLGVFTMCFASANMLGAPLGGYVLGALGGPALWGGTLALCMAAGVLFAAISRSLSTNPSPERSRT